jgi:hypothetical protein
MLDHAGAVVVALIASTLAIAKWFVGIFAQSGTIGDTVVGLGGVAALVALLWKVVADFRANKDIRDGYEQLIDSLRVDNQDLRAENKALRTKLIEHEIGPDKG